MNKRIKKKRAHLSPRRIGCCVYTYEEIRFIIMKTLMREHLLPRIYFVSLYTNSSDVYVWRKNNMKRALKYMYKNWSEYLCTGEMSYKHLRFARHLNESTSPAAASNSCEAMSMEAD